MTTKTIKDKPECICRYFTDNLGVEQRITKPACPKHGKASILRKELTLTERVHALERKTKEHDERLERIELHLHRKGT